MQGCSLLPVNPLREAVAITVLAVYVMLIVVPVSRLLHSALVRRGVSEESSRYYVRKFIHGAAGGVVALLVPLVFTSPLLPTLAALALAALLLVLHGRLSWFQVSGNMYDVNFNIAWGASIAVLWCYTGDPWTAVLPALFISFGDAATGIVRNMVFGHRTKHWLGNVAMAAVSVPIGVAIAGWIGLVAALVSSAVEKFEAGVVDDNVLIALSSTLVILAAAAVGQL
ncbi:hypothetical protein APE_2054.1 [Aeropyrum pernix K1]|uniref:Dolichol kinase n=1 Tax=Aeropyrum pernix (strain ATCC 700893 / DSM 11879 / JCM 9820 / NBRC 100138 / K1) TaxID=272557 RepID=Q9YA85_AERPE|nr:hypothetical protein [Aeropyrum pernix]BAA81064.2 hypothetical protein APE_2054.1 [Aeropyrum pernix K1]